MTILAMDTTGPSLSVAIARDGKIVYECFQRTGHTHSERLMPMIDAALQAQGTEPSQLDALAVTVGPGSFTGVRIGVETAKALCHALEKPCVPVNALEAIARGAGGFAGVVCPMQDARAGQVYCAAYRGGERILPDGAMKLGEFLESLPDGDGCLFIGDGAEANREKIVQAMGERAVFAQAGEMNLRAANAALIACERLETAVGWREVAPYYLRKPQAEREREAREAASHAE